MGDLHRRNQHRVCRLLIAFLLLLTLGAAAETAKAPHRQDIPALLLSAQTCGSDLCRYSLLQQALRLDPASEDANLALADYYSRRGQLKLSRTALTSVLDAAPQSRAALVRILELDIREGYRQQALDRLRSLEPPTDQSERTRFAQAYEHLGLYREAAKHAAAALSVAPKDAELQAVVTRLSEKLLDPQLMRQVGAALPGNAVPNDLRAAWSGDASTPALNTRDEDAPYLADVTKLERPKNFSGGAQLLADILVERVQPNGLSSKRVQQVVYLGNSGAARSYTTRRIQYEPSIEKLSIIRALLHKPDGSVIAATDEGDSFVADLGSSMYYDSRSRLLRFANPEPGDILELDYRTQPIARENPYGNYFASLQVLQQSTPTHIKRYALIAPSDRELFITAERAPDPQVSTRGGMTTRVWEVRGVAALPDEPLSPPVTERAPYVHISTLRDAADLGRWYSQMLEPQLTLSPELKQVADDIRETTPEPLDRINAVYRYVLAHSRYVAFEFGIHSYKPYPVSQAYVRRFGDCKDDASLIVSLLREAGVDSEFALVRTRSLGHIRPEAASLSLFNHAMVYVPQFKLWLDGTATFFGMGELPVEDQGATAVTVARNGDAQLRTVTLTRSEDNAISRTIRAEINKTGSITFEGEQLTRGESAPALRREYERADQQKDAMQRSLAAVVPNLRVDGMRIQNKTSDPAIDVSFQGVLEPTASADDDTHSLIIRSTWSPRDYRRKLASLDSRTQELVLGAPWKSEENFTFKLPPGARVVSAPEAVRIAGPFGSATLAYKIEGDLLQISTAVEFTATRVQPADYASFRQFCSELDRAFGRSVRLELQ